MVFATPSSMLGFDGAVVGFGLARSGMAPYLCDIMSNH